MLCICIGLQNKLIWRECEVIGGQSNQDDRQYNTIVPMMRMKMMMTLIIKMMMTETSEILVSGEFSRFFLFSLLVLDLEPFQFHFHFSKKSKGILFFTFHFSEKVKAMHISLCFLEKKE